MWCKDSRPNLKDSFFMAAFGSWKPPSKWKKKLRKNYKCSYLVYQGKSDKWKLFINFYIFKFFILYIEEQKREISLEKHVRKKITRFKLFLIILFLHFYFFFLFLHFALLIFQIAQNVLSFWNSLDYFNKCRTEKVKILTALEQFGTLWNKVESFDV